MGFQPWPYTVTFRTIPNPSRWELFAAIRTEVNQNLDISFCLFKSLLIGKNSICNFHAVDGGY